MDDSVEKATIDIENMIRDRPRLLRPMAPQPEPEPEPVPVPEMVEEKIDHTLLPIDALEEVSRTLMVGRDKHGAWNWTISPLPHTHLLAKATRHILAFQKGEDIDPGTGRSHIACAICDLLFLQSHIITGLGTDDRFKR